MKNILFQMDELHLKLNLIIRNKNHKSIEYNEEELKLFIESCINKYFEDPLLVKINN